MRRRIWFRCSNSASGQEGSRGASMGFLGLSNCNIPIILLRAYSSAMSTLAEVREERRGSGECPARRHNRSHTDITAVEDLRRRSMNADLRQPTRPRRFRRSKKAPAHYPAISTTPQSPASEAKASSLPVLRPAHAGDRALAGAAQQRLLLVGNADAEDHAVDEADREDILGRVECDRGRHDVGAGAEFERRLAHRAVLGGEGPDDRGRRAGGGEPLALRRPGHAT